MRYRLKGTFVQAPIHELGTTYTVKPDANRNIDIAVIVLKLAKGSQIDVRADRSE